MWMASVAGDRLKFPLYTRRAARRLALAIALAVFVMLTCPGFWTDATLYAAVLSQHGVGRAQKTLLPDDLFRRLMETPIDSDLPRDVRINPPSGGRNASGMQTITPE